MIGSAAALAAASAPALRQSNPGGCLGENSSAETKSKDVISKRAKEEAEVQDTLNSFTRSERKTELPHNPL